MVLLNLFQLLQAVLAVILLVCVFKKAYNKREFHIALVCLVVSIMIIPPFGREYVNGATIEGASGDGASSDSSVDMGTCMDRCDNSSCSGNCNCDLFCRDNTVKQCIIDCKQYYPKPSQCNKICVSST